MDGCAPEKSDRTRYSAEPVSDYWQAVWRLAEYLADTGEDMTAGAVPWLVVFVADVFWLRPEEVRADLEACLESV